MLVLPCWIVLFVNLKMFDGIHLCFILGTGAAGKSTFIKNLRMMHSGYTEQERKENIKIMHTNILEGIVLF